MVKFYALAIAGCLFMGLGMAGLSALGHRMNNDTMSLIDQAANVGQDNHRNDIASLLAPITNR